MYPSSLSNLIILYIWKASNFFQREFKPCSLKIARQLFPYFLNPKLWIVYRIISFLPDNNVGKETPEVPMICCKSWCMLIINRLYSVCFQYGKVFLRIKRLHTLCNKGEIIDEFHFILQCSAYKQLSKKHRQVDKTGPIL